MQIYSINTSKYNYNFTSKKSNCLKFKNDDFFVKIRGFGKNIPWVRKIKETANIATNQIQEKQDFYCVIDGISNGVRKANQFTLSLEKRKHTGILRELVKKDGTVPNWSQYPLTTSYTLPRYKIYETRLDKLVDHPLRNPYKNISLTMPCRTFFKEKLLMHGRIQNVKSALKKVNEIYNKILKSFIINEDKEKNIEELNSLIAEIRWIMAHATPWERGSDAISNVFMRALYKACQVKTYPFKKGISLDLEAYCTELEDYKKNFPKYFEQEPRQV